MADVPWVDYQEKTIKVVLDEAVKQLPPKVRAIYKDKELSHFVAKDRGHFGVAYVSYPGKNLKLPADVRALVDEYQASHAAQAQTLSDLRDKLKRVAYSSSSRKALFNALPEFEKYLPADEAAACKTLPAVANVVSDFVKAGWPKGNTK